MSKYNYRPSSLHRRERCPASGRLEYEAPEQESTESSDEGVRLHDLTAIGIKEPKARNKIRAELDIDETAKVNQCWDAVAETWAQLSPEQKKRAIVLVEKPVDCRNIGIDHDGTPDLAIIIPGTETESGIVIVLDWKMGFSYVSPARFNLQLISYLSSLYRHYSIDGYGIAGIVQPEVRDYTDTATLQGDELLKFPERIARIKARCEKENAPAVPGGWCQFCDAAQTCPARRAVVAEVKASGDPVQVIGALEPEARTEYYERLKETIKALESGKKEIDKAILLESVFVPGYGARAGRKSRFWADADAAEMALKQIAVSAGDTPDSVMQLITVAAAEKRYGKSVIPSEIIASKNGNPFVGKVKKK